MHGLLIFISCRISLDTWHFNCSFIYFSLQIITGHIYVHNIIYLLVRLSTVLRIIWVFRSNQIFNMTYRTDEFNYNYSTDLIHRENYYSPMRLQPPPKEMGSQTSKIKEIYLKQFNFPNCGNSSKFKILVKIGRGIFG